MRRAGLVLFWLGIACGNKETPAPVGPAGKVVAVEGEAWAQRAAAASPRRTLALDGEVWADDTVITADKASVKILLSHNEVVWILEGGQQKRVDASLAWRAPKGSGDPALLASIEKERTGSAGRHTEKEALETVQTAVPEKEEEAKTRAAPPKKEEAKPAEKRPPPKPEPAPARATPPAPAAAPAPAPPHPPEAPEAAPSEAAPSLPVVAAPPPPPETAKPPPAPQRAAGGGAKKEPEPMETIGRGGSAADKPSGSGDRVGAITEGPRVSLVIRDVSGGLERDIVQRHVRRYMSPVRYCYEKSLQRDPRLAGSVEITFDANPSGVVYQVRATRVDAGLDEVGRCVVGVVRGWRLPAAESAVTATIVYKLGN